MLKRLRQRGEGGFTLVEMTVASFLGVIVMASVLTLFDRGSKTEVVLQQVATSQQGAREGLAAVLSDLRAAQPLEAPTSGASLSNAFQFSHVDMATGAKTEAVWQLTGGALVRTALDPITHLPIGTTYRLADVSSISFTWYSRSGAVLDPSDAPQVVQCAIRVTAQLVGQAQGSAHQVEVLADVDLRNLNPGGWCK
jgi:type II secretory pathway pseudopilin PulG